MGVFVLAGALAAAGRGAVVTRGVLSLSLAAGSPLLALAPVFFWRTWRLARDLGSGWTRQRFQRQGLVESGIAVAWAAAVVAAVRLLG